MKRNNSPQWAPRFKEICSSHGFTCGKNSCFRLVGDGVLQIASFKKFLSFPFYELSLGLLSVYGEINREWLSDNDPLAHYSAINFIGKNLIISLTQEGKTNRLHTISEETQLDIFQTRVVPYFDTIVSQSQLAEAMCELDIMQSNMILWNDPLKYAPFLSCGNYESAEKIIQTMLNQYWDAIESNREQMTACEFDAYQKRMNTSIQRLENKLELAQCGDKDRILAYLSLNYEHNLNLMKFISSRKNNL